MKLEARIIGNRVHEVGYRVFLLHRAIELGCKNFSAYNRFHDGLQMVVVLVEGTSDQIAGFRKYASECKPDGSIVSSIAFQDCQDYVMPIDDYIRISTVEQLNKGIPAIVRLDKKQDRMLEMQEKMLGMQEIMLRMEEKALEKQDVMIEKQDVMIEKQDQMLQKQDRTIAAVDDCRADIVSEIGVFRKEVTDKLDENREAIIDEIGDRKGALDDRLKRIERDISKIKAKVGV